MMYKLTLLATLFACSPDSASAGTALAPAVEEGKAVAVFAGGCFWCSESDFEKVEGVASVESGYTGGPEVGPTYQDVSYGRTGHYEAVRVVYDPAVIDYAGLLEVYWRHIDPTQADGQFCDWGEQYRSAIFTSDPDERALAEKTRAEVSKKLGDTVVTEVLSGGPFWLAEDYHQDFYKTNPVRYQSYRKGCGRDKRLEQLWGPKTATPAPH